MQSAASNSNGMTRGEWIVRFLSWLLLLAVVVLFIYGASLWFKQQMDRPVQSVVINGEFARVSRDQVADTVYAALGNSFMQLDLNTIQVRLEQEPWIDRATVARHWPDKLDITVVENKPIARWGKYNALNQRGELIELSATSSQQAQLDGLPQLLGEVGREQQVMQRYYSVSKLLAEQHLKLHELSQDATGSWQMRIDDPAVDDHQVVVKVGRDHMPEKIQRLLLVFRKQLQARWAEVESIDLRYFNGVAVAWNKPSVSDTKTANDKQISRKNSTQNLKLTRVGMMPKGLKYKEHKGMMNTETTLVLGSWAESEGA